jgi:Bacteriophage tail sheath protein
MRAVATVPGLYFTVSPPKAEPSPLRSDVAGFIGRTKRGPVGVPIRVEGWRGYQREFGGLAADSVLTYAVRGYFDNEGEVAHVIRLVSGKATAAFAGWKVGAVDADGLWLTDAPTGFDYPSYRIEATSPGKWANNTRIQITYRSKGARGTPELDVAISVPGEPAQYFTALGLDERRSEKEGAAQTFADFILEGSRFIRITPSTLKPGGRNSKTGPHSITWNLVLDGGSDGEKPDSTLYLDAAVKLGEVPEVALVAVPGLFEDLGNDQGEQREVLAMLVEQAEDLRDRVVLIDVPTDALDPEQALRDVNETLRWVEDLRLRVDNKAARTAAVYHPRLTVSDPLGGLRHPLRNVPPSGHVAGVISRLDRQRGAHHTPANAEIFNTVDITQRFDYIEQSRFNTAGTNLLRCSAGNGLLVWGGRTLNLDPDRRFIVYRRLIHRLVRAIRRVAEPLVFDINGPELWLALSRSITSVLLEAWRAGALKGEVAAEAFRVKCDEELNPPEEQELGRVHCDVSVAPATPMEFIELRISLSADGRLEVFES